MFLVNKLAKMKHATRLGSRIAEVHNGSSLFTGDAGQGESNIRRWIIENDWLEAIIALPENMFYNTGITTYIWVLTNRKSEARKSKLQLIDASEWFTPLCRNLGKKNRKFSEAQLRAIADLLVNPAATEQSRIFPNAAFGYWEISVERPLCLAVDLSPARLKRFDRVAAEAREEPAARLARHVAAALGAGPHLNFNAFMDACAVGQQWIPSDFVKNYPISLSSLEEQRHITKFLNAMGGNIQRLIRNKQRLIKLLKEQKQNVINQTVNQRLDPNVKLKPSGSEWLGDIPEHWGARKLKFAAKMIVGGGDSSQRGK